MIVLKALMHTCLTKMYAKWGCCSSCSVLTTSAASLLLRYSCTAATAVALYCTASLEGAPAVGLLGELFSVPAQTGDHDQSCLIQG